MTQEDKAKKRSKSQHGKSHALKRDKPHRAVIKGRKTAKKQARRSQRRVDRAVVKADESNP